MLCYYMFLFFNCYEHVTITNTNNYGKAWFAFVSEVS